MFGFDKIKQDIIIIAVIALALFGAYNYVKDLKSTIAEKDKVIISLNVTINNRDETIKDLKAENNKLQKDVKMEEEMCELRMNELTFFYDAKLDAAIRAANNKKTTSNKITQVRNDPTKSDAQKSVEILNIEYDALEASNLFKSVK